VYRHADTAGIASRKSCKKLRDRCGRVFAARRLLTRTPTTQQPRVRRHEGIRTMKILQTLLLTAIAATMIGCVNSPRDDSFLPESIWQPIPLNGITNTPNDLVKFQAFNFSTGQWDDIATTTSGNTHVTDDDWYSFDAGTAVLAPDHWEALTQSPTYRRHAKVRAIFPNNGGDILGYFSDGEAANNCIMTNYENAGSIAGRQNCQIGQSFADVYSCKFGSAANPCPKWF
jgi:hypothetical protein